MCSLIIFGHSKSNVLIHGISLPYLIKTTYYDWMVTALQTYFLGYKNEINTVLLSFWLPQKEWVSL